MQACFIYWQETMSSLEKFRIGDGCTESTWEMAGGKDTKWQEGTWGDDDGAQAAPSSCVHTVVPPQSLQWVSVGMLPQRRCPCPSNLRQRGTEMWESPLLAALQDKNRQSYEDHSIQHWWTTVTEGYFSITFGWHQWGHSGAWVLVAYVLTSSRGGYLLWDQGQGVFWELLMTR